jgi:hypothetical protein
MNRSFLHSCSIQAGAFTAINLILALLVCLTGCNKSGLQTSAIPSSTKSSDQPTGSTSSPTGLNTQPSSPIPPTTKSTPRPRTVTPVTPGNRIAEMLAVIPDIPEARDGIYYVDFTACRKASGIDISKYVKPDGYPVEGGENNYINDLVLFPEGTYFSLWLGAPPFISGMWVFPDLISLDSVDWNKILRSPIRKENIGYGPLDVERSIKAWVGYEGLGNIYYEAIKGNFDPGTISQVTAKYEDPERTPQLSTYDGVDIYIWEESRRAYELNPPVFDNTGQGRTLAVQKNDIFGSEKTEHVFQMIEASHGQVYSLADNPEFADMADNLAKMGIMSATMTDDVLKTDDSWNDEPTEPYLAELFKERKAFFEKADDDAPLMGPYSTFATGLGKDERGLFVAIVLIYDSPETANNEIGMMQKRLATGRNSEDKPWVEEIDSSEVWAEGRAVCAKLRGNVTNYWTRFLWNEPLLVRVN